MIDPGPKSLADAESAPVFNHDRIEVGRVEGKFSKLTVFVENSDLEMIDIKIEMNSKLLIKLSAL